MLVSKSAFSKIAGVSTAAITQNSKPGGALYDAMCGKQVDTTSEAARIYLRKKGLDPNGSQLAVPPPPNIIAEPVPDGLSDTQKFKDMTLSDITAIFGTDTRFKVWTEARKRLTDIDKNEIANAKAAGQLVARSMVKTGILDPIDTVFATLQTDTSKTISIRVVAMALAGAPHEDIKKFVVDQISSVITPAKVKIKRILKG